VRMWEPERAHLQAPAASALPALHVLLAEDDTPSLCIISRLLTACGYRGARTPAAYLRHAELESGRAPAFCPPPPR